MHSIRQYCYKFANIDCLSIVWIHIKPPHKSYVEVLRDRSMKNLTVVWHVNLTHYDFEDQDYFEEYVILLWQNVCNFICASSIGQTVNGKNGKKAENVRRKAVSEN